MEETTFALPTKEEVQPIGDWMTVEPMDLPEVSHGGVLIPMDSTTSAPVLYGKVLSVGPGFWQNGVNVPLTVKPGDVIMYRKGRGLEMRFGGEKVIFMTERDLFAVIKQ